MSRTTEHPARLYVILARRAPLAVVFRRGPSKWVQLIRWHTDTDTFDPGQWFHGRVYERWADLSPNGRYLIYFAAKFGARELHDAEHPYAWTAISKPPWFTALAFWPEGSCWSGGGLFETNRVVLLDHPPEAMAPRKGHPPRGLDIRPFPHDRAQTGSVYFRRLLRDGWEMRPPRQPEGPNCPAVLEKAQPGTSRLLVMRAGWKDGMFALCEEEDTAELPLEGVEWADWDQRGRLVYARAGKLLARECAESACGDEQELHDFNAAEPEPAEAPDWGKRW